jgi:hypothetical protein
VGNQEVALDLWKEANRDALDEALLELPRLLHNFLVGAATLRDHTRGMVRELYTGSPFLAEYNAEIESRFAVSPVSGFVQDLRNYIVHRSILPIRAQLQFKRAEPLQSTARLDVAALLEWDRCSARSQDYLREAGGSIDLKRPVDEYAAIVEDFDRWLAVRTGDLNAEDLREFVRLKRELDSALGWSEAPDDESR